MMTFFIISLILVIFSIFGLLYRVFRGPSIPDRIVALDAIGILLISSVALLSIIFKTHFFIDIILLVAILSFIGTVAFSKFIEKGEIIEDDRTR